MPAGGEVAPVAPPGAPARFSTSDKLGSVLMQALERAHADTGSGGRAVRTLERAWRWGIFRPLRELFPSLEDEETWSQLLAISAGLALELQADGTELDIEACRQAARDLLANLYA